MKKSSLVLTLFFAAVSLLNAQEGNEHKFRFGLIAQPSFNWYKPEDAKKFSSGGARMKFAWGLSTEFKLSENIWFCTGLSVNYDGGSLNFTDSTYYFKNSDGLVESKTAKAANYVGYDAVKLNKRTYNVTYVNLPINLKMKTKEIGYLNYFGLFGINLGFRAKATVDDEGKEYKAAAPNLELNYSETKINNNSDMQIFRAGLNIGGGAEWNLSGSTSLVFGLSYNLGFTNVLKGESRYLIRSATNNLNPQKQKATSQNILLTVGVLF